MATLPVNIPPKNSKIEKLRLRIKASKIFFPNEKFEELVFKNNTLNNKLAIVLPHPSPLNKKWIKDHPKFMNERIIEVRKIKNKIILDE